MENLFDFLAPTMAVVFFMLVGVFIYCFYNKSCDRREESDIEKQAGQLNDDAECNFVERKRSPSAVNDYLVVVHY